MNGEISVRLFKYEPGGAEPPRYERHVVPRSENMRILDVLDHVFDTNPDNALAHRWYCGTKKCGECAVTVNGRPMLACWEPAEDEMTIEPLANFPIVRDLVVDTRPYEKMIVQMRPHITRTRKPPFPEKISASVMAGAEHLSKCIECNACTAVVPADDFDSDAIRWTENPGPAALVRFARFVLDARDETDRAEAASRHGLPNFTGYRVLRDICPQGIDIIEDALVPASRKLFGGSVQHQIDVELDSTTPLVMAPQWSAFLRMTPERKQALVEQGRLVRLDLPEFREVFTLSGMADR